MLNEKYQMLLDQYDLDIDYVRRGRGGLLCQTNQGTFALSQTSLSEERLWTIAQWTMQLKEAHFSNVDQYILNRNGSFLSYDKYYESYALRKTFSGTECDIHSLKDLKVAASNLGIFHRCCQNLTFSCENSRNYDSIHKRYQQKYSELKSIARYIRSRKSKGTFEYLFLEQTKDFWNQAEQSLKLLETSLPSQKGWCHGAYNHHNIIMTGKFPATVHFEHFFYGYPILDLYYFLRKVLEKNDYCFSFCDTLLCSYHKEFPLSEEDYRCLYGLLLFPEKFWKISNQYMGHKKHWVSPRYIDKLEEFVHSKDLRAFFLEKYVQIYNVF